MDKNSNGSESEDSSTPLKDQGASLSENELSDTVGQDDSTNELDEIKKRVKDLEDDLSTANDKHLRARAETENIRRRFEKEKSDLLRYGVEGLMKDLLPVLDSFEKAVDAEKEGASSDSIADGVKMVNKQLVDTLSKHGLEPIDSKGVAFDPNLHQAIQKLNRELELNGPSR